MSELDSLIEQLGEADAGPRQKAAARLYDMGRALAEDATVRWREEKDFSALLVPPPIVGVAVPPASFARIHAAWGMPHLAEVPADQDAQEFELQAGAAQLDILTTRNEPAPPGAIAKFLEKFGAGIQQVEYRVTDVDRATAILKARLHVAPVYPETRAGANGTRVNFFLVSTPANKKVLIELYEEMAEGREYRVSGPGL